jgi:hypothetical protein
MPGKMRNTPDEYKLQNSRRSVTGEDDVEGHSMKRSFAPGESLKGSGPDELKLKNSRRSVTGEDDVEGHWMPDAGSSMRLAKARNSDIERDARQHQLANDARQHRLDNDPKRTHQKG